MMKIISVVRQTFRRQAGKGLDVTNKMRLIMEAERVGNNCQRFKLPGFHESYGFVKALHPDIHLRGNAHRLAESPFKLAF